MKQVISAVVKQGKNPICLCHIEDERSAKWTVTLTTVNLSTAQLDDGLERQLDSGHLLFFHTRRLLNTHSNLIMSQSQSSAVVWHEFYNDPTSDIYLRSNDGVRLGTTRHRLRGLSPVLDGMFSLPKSASPKKREVEEVDMDYGSDVLAVVLTFANCPIKQTSTYMVAHLHFEQCRQLLGFLRVFECPDNLRHLTLYQWCYRARTHKDRVSIIHAVAVWGWTGGIDKAFSALNLEEVYANSSTFWSFIDGFPGVQQKELLRTIIRIDQGHVTLPSILKDLATAVSPNRTALPGPKRSEKPVESPKKKPRL